MQIPGQPKGLAPWWGPKDDRALLQGYHQQGGIPWNTRAITSAVDAVLSNSSLDFSVKVSQSITAARLHGVVLVMKAIPVFTTLPIDRQILVDNCSHCCSISQLSTALMPVLKLTAS